MADTPEAIALQLRAFVDSAQRRANEAGHINVSQVYVAPKRPNRGVLKDKLLVVCEQYLSKLTVEERGELAHLIEIMLGAP